MTNDTIKIYFTDNTYVSFNEEEYDIDLYSSELIRFVPRAGRYKDKPAHYYPIYRIKEIIVD